MELELSPRMRGYSPLVITYTFIVIPANAGVILSEAVKKDTGERYPRECGGDPDNRRFVVIVVRLSPRMRGRS